MNTLSPLVDPSNATSQSLDFCIRLSRAQSVITRKLDHTLSSLHGLSFADFLILYYLGRAPGLRLRRIDLAERLGLTASGVTRSLLPLEKLGLVSRQADPRDARVGFATLSEAGRELLQYALTAANTAAQQASEQVSKTQLDAAANVLARLAGMNSTNS
jgi:DNA-binding MarR family transcriptional regulator